MVAVATLCIPKLTGSPEYSDVIVSPGKPLKNHESGFNSKSQSVSSPQPVLPSRRFATVAKIANENKNSGTNHPYNVSVWGTIQTEFSTISNNDRIILYSLSLNKGYTAVSDINGYFYIDGVAPAKDYRMRVIPQGMFKRYVRESVNLTADQTVLSVVLLELPVGTLRGEVVNSNGIKIPGFGIKVRSPEKSQWSANIVTDGVGWFQVENVPIGALEFSSTFGQALIITGHDFKGDLQSPLALVVDQGPNELRGLVYDQYNDLVGGANVILSWVNTEGGTRSAVNRRTTTNPSGQFSIKGIGSGVHDLVLSTTSGFAYRQTINIGNDSADLTITLSQTPLSY